MFLSAWTVQRCSIAAGHSSLVAFQIPAAPSAITSAGAHIPRAVRSRLKPQPALVALARSQLQPEQRLLALERQAPGEPHVLGDHVVGAQLEVNRVEVAVDEIVPAEVALTPRLVALAAVLSDP